MKRIAPDYYRDFACLMGECRHTCCAGWEIDIDDETLEYYRSIPGEAGKRLMANIEEDGEGAHFRMAADERCPFLNREGLCDLIIELGEESLCQICDDHPRFRNFFSDRTEIGLGLCCEAAGKLLLSRTEKVKFVQCGEEDGEEEMLSEDEAFLLELRDELIAIAQDRTISFDARCEQLLDAAESGLADIEPRQWADFFLGLERLDPAWTELLNGLKNAGDSELLQNGELEKSFEQLLVYLLWRHLPGALEDGDIAGRTAFAVLLCRILAAMLAVQETRSIDNLVELVRLCSSEIEYSDENIDAVLGEIERRSEY